MGEYLVSLELYKNVCAPSEYYPWERLVSYAGKSISQY